MNNIVMAYLPGSESGFTGISFLPTKVLFLSLTNIGSRFVFFMLPKLLAPVRLLWGNKSRTTFSQINIIIIIKTETFSIQKKLGRLPVL